ncbi:MAG: hypothetical protein EPO06_02600 [Burkholderiaceae bacterium]|nr:MAG: hypothetical protein EPO06_02600 [Burkholderiaceae bacterium]
MLDVPSIEGLGLGLMPAEPFGQYFNGTVVAAKEEVLHIVEIVGVTWIVLTLKLVRFCEPFAAAHDADSHASLTSIA